ncbi:hypothetical protein FE410_05305 [Leuconostoc carnosum]|uniref:hypothetical protein n=2 Tax=Lactobacillaceae TaxID=33958 RepID=UPI00123A1F3B|nr:hypothetical protein [Leuconostoc carnosum]KAA8371108.1 hypothetical protein FE414_05300 [Leuconostoc carnosum]KAA8382749.1 hypothetical protein FE410_05305 [Leuconostoc carnosum]
MSSILKTMYRDRASIYGSGQSKDGPFTETLTQMIVENYPCKVSKSTQNTSQFDGIGATDSFDAVLFIDTAIKIPAAATIVVTDVNGYQTTYHQSSSGYVGYESHQEVRMKLDKKASEVTHGQDG